MSRAVIVAPVLPATPADRSISPSSSTITRPMASTLIGAACVIRLAMLSLVVKVSLAMLKMTTRTTRPSIAGSEPMSPLRTRVT